MFRKRKSAAELTNAMQCTLALYWVRTEPSAASQILRTAKRKDKSKMPIKHVVI